MVDPYEALCGLLALMLVGSWALFIWLWAWNHKPSRRPDKPKAEPWVMPDNWRN
ncbi:MAG: hypothetical protein JO279_18345 [Verrucomicrobia bacterium]|nr:hypothetical protein [Verrucomicrobiota bacterium]